MKTGDTTLGGAGKAFPETSIGFAGGLRDGGSLEGLPKRYWKPGYSYIRIAWAKSNEDAKDLTQEFFLWLLEDGAIARYDRERGGFRPYLKVLLRRFAGHEERDLRRLKRGGGASILSLEGDAPPLPADETDPEKVFERVWLEELVGEAMGRVRERFRGDGKEERFRAYELVLGGSSYADAAERLRLSVGEVEKSLYLIREEIRREMRASIAQGAASDRELEHEWQRLLDR